MDNESYFDQKYKSAKDFLYRGDYIGLGVAIANLRDYNLSREQERMIDNLERDGFRIRANNDIADATRAISEGKKYLARAKISGLIIHPLLEDFVDIRERIDSLSSSIR